MLTKVGNGNRETGADKEGKCGFPNQSVNDANAFDPKPRKPRRIRNASRRAEAAAAACSQFEIELDPSPYVLAGLLILRLVHREDFLDSLSPPL